MISIFLYNAISKQARKIAVSCGLIICLSALNVGCSNGVNFASSIKPTSNGAQSLPSSNLNPPNSSNCSPQSANNLRILFMVDASGSTTSDDLNASVRGQSALNFLQANIDRQNLSYSYSYFASDLHAWDFASSSFVAINSSTHSVPNQIFGSAAQTHLAVDKFVNGFKIFANAFSLFGSLPAGALAVNSNSTNYDIAFQLLKAEVLADRAANPNSNYAIIFMSDGQPNDGQNISSSDINANLVQPLMAAAGPGHLTISTVYFNTQAMNDPTEQALMASIAAAGSGPAINDVTDSKPLNLTDMIQNIIAVPTQACSGQ